MPTKRLPIMLESGFLTGDNIPGIEPQIFEAFQIASLAIEKGNDFVIPADGIGTGLAELPRRAPLIAKLIDERIERLQGSQTGAKSPWAPTAPQQQLDAPASGCSRIPSRQSSPTAAARGPACRFARRPVLGLLSIVSTDQSVLSGQAGRSCRHAGA